MNVILIVTKDSTLMTDNPVFKVIEKCKKMFSEIFEIEEQIDGNGDVIIDLRESVINDLLRQIFKERPEVVVIALQNSNHNPLHEKTLQNLLYSAGYKSVYVSYKEDKFISFLSSMFANSISE